MERHVLVDVRLGRWGRWRLGQVARIEGFVVGFRQRAYNGDAVVGRSNQDGCPTTWHLRLDGCGDAFPVHHTSFALTDRARYDVGFHGGVVFGQLETELEGRFIDDLQANLLVDVPNGFGLHSGLLWRPRLLLRYCVGSGRCQMLRSRLAFVHDVGDFGSVLELVSGIRNDWRLQKPPMNLPEGVGVTVGVSPGRVVDHFFVFGFGLFLLLFGDGFFDGRLVRGITGSGVGTFLLLLDELLGTIGVATGYRGGCGRLTDVPFDLLYDYRGGVAR